MDEHADDRDAEVDEGADVETFDFPDLAETGDNDDDGEDNQDDVRKDDSAQTNSDIDPDPSEL